MRLFKTKEASQSIHLKNNASGILVLGSGCAKCKALEANVKQALRELGKDMEVIHVSDYAQIASYGIMSTPALIVNGVVKSYGKLLTVNEIKELLGSVL